MAQNLKTITAEELESRALEIIDEINKTNETLIITRNGKPIAKLIPLEKEYKQWFRSSEIQEKIRKAEEEVKQGKGKEFTNFDAAIEWLKSSK